MTPKEVVIAYWESMQSNDFAKASEWLAEDFECFWPQSSELIVGRENFAAINSYYPADGEWVFTINAAVAEHDTVVTDVSVTDGVRQDRVITFHTVKDGFIRKQAEFWPDDYPAPEWRKQWVKIV
ncbi:nuclear transport factor 2 family protein [Photobacterium sp. TY1-4]|uniref:nuclear transport factor 2 family protein n=1 Tax=Photobacterium sp. TY1-4 TaxID=2899122 RepID=UPI0021C1F1AC|nr:nuclear transport factor 2 family protein [Photobacterium sp. TY1-4]UXI04616.1 nuclear transport factor 2 family protein [Photobacterium sp. TY1-4]